MELLTQAGELLDATLGPLGRTVGWRVTQADHTAVSYAVRVEWSDGRVTDETFGVAKDFLPGTVRLSDGTTEVGVWRFPFDPDLPALATACDPARMTALANRLGLPGTARLTVRTYRPRRRAVVEVTTAAGSVFVKVSRPKHIDRIHEVHRVAGGRTPKPLGWTPDGLLVLAALPGTTLRDALVAGQSEVDTDDVVAVLDELSPALATGPLRRTWGQKAGHYAEVVATTVPALARRARAVAAAVDHSAPEGPPVPVHGDFYEQQLLMSGPRVTGLLDVDTAGRGERLDDAACLLAHLDVLAQLHPGLRHPGPALFARFARDLDPAALARRTAAVVLSLAPGPHRVRAPKWRRETGERVALAESWLERS